MRFQLCSLTRPSGNVSGAAGSARLVAKVVAKLSTSANWFGFRPIFFDEEFANAIVLVHAASLPDWMLRVLAIVAIMEWIVADLV
ncbi:MAG: hypothetical protein WAN75_27990 [Xanthobacteraceae bacterium]